MEYIEIGARRDAYSVDDVIKRTLTVGELVEILEEYEDDTPVVLSHDGGYTYGAIHESRITLEETGGEEVYEEEEEIEADDEFDESLKECSCGCGEDHEYSEDQDLDEHCIHCDDLDCDDDFGDHENSYDVDEAHSFKGLNDRFGGRTLAESLRVKTPIRKNKKK